MIVVYFVVHDGLSKQVKKRITPVQTKLSLTWCWANSVQVNVVNGNRLICFYTSLIPTNVSWNPAASWSKLPWGNAFSDFILLGLLSLCFHFTATIADAIVIVVPWRVDISFDFWNSIFYGLSLFFCSFKDCWAVCSRLFQKRALTVWCGTHFPNPWLEIKSLVKSVAVMHDSLVDFSTV